MLWESSSSIFNFPNGRTVSLEGLPPAPAVWGYTIVDLLCAPLRCEDWRSNLGVPEDSWLSEQYKMPYLSESFPDLLTYGEFRKEHGTSLSSLYKFAFETPSTALGSLASLESFFVLFFLVFFIRQIKAVMMPFLSSIGRNAALKTHGEQWVYENQVRILKFGEYVFRLMYHSLISLYGLYLFRDAIWWQPGQTLKVFEGFPHHEIAPSMAWYYLIQSAYNVDAFLALMELSFVLKRRCVKTRSNSPWKQAFPYQIEWSPTSRGDFREMFIHHFATNVLVFGSSSMRFTRIGSMVFMLHDISDIPVDLSKLANFMKWHWTTVVCFVTMMMTWLYTRLIILPGKIFWTVITQCHYTLEEGVPVIHYVAYRHFFYFFLGMLISLHAFWFLMFVRMLLAILIKNECHDYSEHKNGEHVVAPSLPKKSSDDDSSLHDDDDGYHGEEKKDDNKKNS